MSKDCPKCRGTGFYHEASSLVPSKLGVWLESIRCECNSALIMVDELKPCPFCGSEDVTIKEIMSDCGYQSWWELKCANDEACGCSVSNSGTKEEVIKKWNKRVKQ